MASGCTHLETLFVSLDDLDNISILLDKDKELEEEITYLFNKVSIFTFKFGKKQNQSGSKYTQNNKPQCGVTSNNFKYVF